MTNNISYDEIVSIQRKTNIVDIIRDYVPLTQKGKNFFGVCPFHDDHNPSMSVSVDKQIYKCFVCGNSGNVFNFVMEYEKISFIEAVKIIADKQGISVNINTNNNVKVDKSNDRLYKIYDIANKYYQNNLNTSFSKDAKKYLYNRKLDDDIIKEFNIGVSFNDSELYNILNKKGFTDNEILDSALCFKSASIMQDIYKNRIMFPLFDLNGNTVGFSGRVYLNKDENKYINTKETKIFKKGELLYNYHRAKPIARKEKSVIIVEGFMAAIRLWTIGVKNVVATMGTAVTKQQANLIDKMAPNIILMFDGDEAGAKATQSYLENYGNNSDKIKIVRLEDNLDPDDYILQKGKEKMLYQLSHPISIYDFKINAYKNKIDFTNSKDVSEYIKLVLPEIEKIDDDIIRDIEINKLSKLTNVDKDFLLSKIKQNDNKELKINKKKEVKLSKYDKASKYIIYRMLKDPNMILYYFNNLSYLPNELYRKLANEMVLFYKKYNSFNLNDFVIYLEDKKDLINLIIDIDDEHYINDEDNIDDYFNVIKENLYQTKINKLTNDLKNESNEVKRKEIAKQIVEIKMKESK